MIVNVFRNLRRCVAVLLVPAFLIGSHVDRAVGQPADAQDLRLVEFTPWLTKKNGPANAKGVIYFIRGWGGLVRGGQSLDAFQLVPYMMKTLSENGWDIVGAKFPNRPTTGFSSDYVPAAVTYVERRLRELKGQGYQRVVVAGHSWGAWVAMATANSLANVHAVMAIAPNSFGPQVLPNGRANPRFQRNVSEFALLASASKAPVVLMLFAEDDFESGERGKTAQREFAKNKVAHLVIDKHPAFKGHFAGWPPIFDYAYGPCIQSFLDSTKAVECRLAPLSNDDVRSVVNLRQVANVDAKRITSAGSLVGKKFAAYPLEELMRHFNYVEPSRRQTMTSALEFDETVEFRDGLHCARERCSTLVRWSDRSILEFDTEKGQLRGWWFER